MSVANGNPAVIRLVRLAWREPRYHTQEMRERAVQEFRDKLFMVCFDVRGLRYRFRYGRLVTHF